MSILNYRKTTTAEDKDFNLKCNIMKQNHMQCTRRVTRVVNNNVYMCEGHFQIERQTSIAAKDTLIDQDEPIEEVTGISEPLEKSL